MSPQQFDAWRIAPRLFMVMYGVVFYRVISWFMSLTTPTESQAAFVVTVVGAAAAFFKFYVQTGTREHET